VPNVLGGKVNHCLQNGIPQWVSTTTYLVGNVVNRSNDLWKCLISNTNSIPADGNANWDKMLSVATPPSLNSVLPSQTGNNGKVLRTNGINASWEFELLATVNFDRVTSANVAATYTQSGTTVIVTSNNHGHRVGHYVFCGTFTGGSAVVLTMTR